MNSETRRRVMLSMSMVDYHLQPSFQAEGLERFAKRKLRDEIHRFDTAQCGYEKAIENCRKVIADIYKTSVDKVIAENTDGNELRFTIKDQAGIVFYEYSTRLGREDEC